MSTLRLSPRQKMINMMYLVLTAILALNISKEVLDSFVTLNDDLTRSGRSHEQRLASAYADFEKAARQIPEKYTGPLTEAMAIRSQADSLVERIEQMKALVMAGAEGLPLNQVRSRDAQGSDTLMSLWRIGRKDDRETLTRLLVGSEPASPKHGPNTAADLKDAVGAFRDRLVSMTGDREPRLTTAVQRLFDLGDRRDASGTMNNWESINFYDVPLVAGIAALSKLQTDIRSAENDVVQWLHNSVEADIFKVDRLMAAVIPQSDHVMIGDSFRADVFLAAYDSRNSPEILFGPASPVAVGPDGRAKLRLAAESLGEQKGEGLIRFHGPDGPLEFPYAINYQVVAPALVASPTKMNVLYRYVDNPVAVSVPGIPADRITAAINNGSITRGPDGMWVVQPGAPGEAGLEAVVAMPEGGTRRIGPMVFRVKDLPPPAAFVMEKTSSDRTIRKGELSVAEGIIARLVDSDFNAQFKVIQFEVQIIRHGDISFKQFQGNRFDEQLKEAFGAIRVNDQVIFQDIRAVLKNGKGRIYPLPTIALKVVS